MNDREDVKNLHDILEKYGELLLNLINQRERFRSLLQEPRMENLNNIDPNSTIC